MRHSPPSPWHDAVIAAKQRDWCTVAEALRRAPRIALRTVAGDDYLRPAVMVIALHSPRPVAEILRRKITAADGTVHRATDWPRHMVQGTSLLLATQVAVALSQPRWPQLCATFRRLVGVPRVASAQERAIEAIGTILLDTACVVEAALPSSVLGDDDLGLQDRTATMRMRGLRGAFRLPAVAHCLGSLTGSPHYPQLAREVLFQAISRLHWPTLRACGWLSYTPLPGGADGTFEALLCRRIVRAVSRPPYPDDPEIDF